MKIRMAQNCDIPGMIALLDQVGEVHHRIRPDLFRSGARKYGHQDLQNLLQDVDKPIFVAVEGEAVVGYCFCRMEGYFRDAIMTDRKELYIDDLCVDENCRGMGVGKALYDHVCGFAKGQGCGFVTLNVWCGNDSAMEFYKNRGMKPRKIYLEAEL